VYDALMKTYEEKHFSAAFESKLNVHNQFLQTTIALGIIGGLLLVSILGYMLVIGFRNNDFILVFLSTVIAVNFLTESMLGREGGLLFFCFWASVLVFYKPASASVLPLDNINKEN
jgi:O-antigen ligase